MNTIKITFAIFLAGLATILTTAAQTQQQQPPQAGSDEEARGAFLVTRKNQPVPTPSSAPAQKIASNPSSNQSSRRPSPTVAKKSPVSKQRQQTPSVAPPINATPASELNVPPIGIGYTLYQRGDQGQIIRVSSSHGFYDGDQVRFVLESNTDGYLYVFLRENDDEPEMIFPDPRLNQGANEIKAHVPYELPASTGPIPWFTFDQNPGVEHLYIVVTRKPLPRVPIGKEIAAYCQPPRQDCTWHPAPSDFVPIRENALAPKLASQNKTLGQLQTEVEQLAIARGLKLQLQSPEPAVVQMNTTAHAEMIVIMTELNHRKR